MWATVDKYRVLGYWAVPQEARAAAVAHVVNSHREMKPIELRTSI
jgi:hypothetical protein